MLTTVYEEIVKSGFKILLKGAFSGPVPFPSLTSTTRVRVNPSPSRADLQDPHTSSVDVDGVYTTTGHFRNDVLCCGFSYVSVAIQVLSRCHLPFI